MGAGRVAQAPGRRLAGPATRSGDARVDRAGLDGVSEAAEAQDAGGGRVSLGAAHRARVRASRNRLDHRDSGRYVGGWSRRGRALDFDGESLPVDPAVAIGVRCCRRADPSERGGSREVAIWLARAARESFGRPRSSTPPPRGFAQGPAVSDGAPAAGCRPHRRPLVGWAELGRLALQLPRGHL